MRAATASLSSRDKRDGKCSITRGSAFSAANGSRSEGSHRRKSSRSVRISRGSWRVSAIRFTFHRVAVRPCASTPDELSDEDQRASRQESQSDQLQPLGENPVLLSLQVLLREPLWESKNQPRTTKWNQSV